MNYYRKQSKNASLRSEKKEWVKITLFLFFILIVVFFGPDIVKILIK